MTEAKSRILAAAVAAFLDSGFEVPISRIWTDAGLSNGSFFHVFKTRRALVEAVVSMILAERQAVRMAVARQSGWRSATIRMPFGNSDELIIRRRSDGGKRYVWS